MRPAAWRMADALANYALSRAMFHRTTQRSRACVLPRPRFRGIVSADFARSLVDERVLLSRMDSRFEGEAMPQERLALPPALRYGTLQGLASGQRVWQGVQRTD